MLFTLMTRVDLAVILWSEVGSKSFEKFKVLNVYVRNMEFKKLKHLLLLLWCYGLQQSKSILNL